jgi:hypothetical protein
LQSNRQKEEILNAVSGKLEHTKIFGLAFHKDSWKQYEGFTDQNRFKFRRILKTGMNSFIPIVQGDVRPIDDGSLINIKSGFIDLHICF